MTQEQAAQAFLMLVAALPSAPTNPGTQPMYVRKLMPLEKDRCARAIDRIIDSWQWPGRLPTVGNIREVYTDLEKSDRRRAEMEQQLRDERAQLAATRPPRELPLSAIGKTMPGPGAEFASAALADADSKARAEACRRAARQWGTRNPTTAAELDAALEEK
jgi:hypothetical protein